MHVEFTRQELDLVIQAMDAAISNPMDYDRIRIVSALEAVCRQMTDNYRETDESSLARLCVPDMVESE